VIRVLWERLLVAFWSVYVVDVGDGLMVQDFDGGWFWMAQVNTSYLHFTTHGHKVK